MFASILGIGYVAWTKITAILIPCPFYAVTGHFCPSCGITRMTLSILKGDLKRAYQYNRLLFILSPYLIILVARLIYHVWHGRPFIVKRVERVFLIAVIILLLIFGILRNLPQFHYLAP